MPSSDRRIALSDRKIELQLASPFVPAPCGLQARVFCFGQPGEGDRAINPVVRRAHRCGREYRSKCSGAANICVRVGAEI